MEFPILNHVLFCRGHRLSQLSANNRNKLQRKNFGACYAVQLCQHRPAACVIKCVNIALDTTFISIRNTIIEQKYSGNGTHLVNKGLWVRSRASPVFRMRL